eukprot:627846-Prorocentrum_minimum.AAC.1
MSRDGRKEKEQTFLTFVSRNVRNDPPPDPPCVWCKSGKEPPLPPGKQEAYQYAAGTLRHVSLLDDAREQIRTGQR